MSTAGPAPLDVPWGEIDLATHSLTGWPNTSTCTDCDGELVQLWSTHDKAQYECRGTPETRPERSAYSADRCGRTPVFHRAEEPSDLRETLERTRDRTRTPETPDR